MSQPSYPHGQPQAHSQGPSQPQGQPHPQGPPAAGPQGQLVVHMRKPAGWGSAAMTGPIITIDNFPAASQWETNVFTVPAGTRQVRCEARYMWAYGPATMNVDVAPGQTAEVYYASPLVSFGPGSIGFEPQERRGKLFFGLVLGIPLGIILLMIVIGITVGLAG